jgi:addiction module RelE/StbE family toxin
MTLRYTRRAHRHLEAIARYISERNPDAAVQVGARIRESIELLEIFSNIGRDGDLFGTRELIVPGLPYVVVYRAARENETAVTILGVYHGAQLRPGQTHRQ